MNFAKGFRKKTKDSAPQQGNLVVDSPIMYPSASQSQNVSGAEKCAAETPMKAPTEPARAPSGVFGGLKSMNQPARKTVQTSPYGAPKGAVGVTGTPVTKPFQSAIGKFGQKPRLGLKSISGLRRRL